jgi:hypothetical protein
LERPVNCGLVRIVPLLAHAYTGKDDRGSLPGQGGLQETSPSVTRKPQAPGRHRQLSGRLADHADRSPVLLNAGDMQSIVDNLFVGNKLSTGQIRTSDGLRIDLRSSNEFVFEANLLPRPSKYQ